MQQCNNILFNLLDSHDTARFINKANLVHNNFYEYSKTKYSGALNKIIIICPNHGEFEQTPNAHLQGNGCPICAVANQGYNRSAYIERAKKYDNKSKLYILKCFNDEEEFYKIGITMTTIRKRYPTKKSMPYKYETTLLLEGEAGQIWDLEKKLHKQFSTLYYTPKLSFAGQYECFKELSEEIITTLNSSIITAKILNN